MRAVDYARRLLSRAPAVQPRTYPSSQKKSGAELFSKRDRSLKELESYEVRYVQGGPVREAIDSYALFALSNGFYVDGKDEALVKDVQARLEELDVESSLWQGIVDALVFGDAFQELVPGQGLRTNDVVMIQPRPAKMFDIVTDDHGIKTGYIQYRDNLWKQRIPLELDHILHISLFHVGGSKYGLSLIGTAKDDIDRDTRTIDGIVNAIEAHGKPRYHARVGEEGEDVDQPVLDRIADQLKDLRTNAELVTCKDTEITVLDAGGVGNTKVYSDLTIQRLACALGTPEEILGLGRGSTEATATVRQKCFEMKIGTIHHKLERCYNSQLIDRLSGVEGAVKLKFNDVSPEDEMKEVDYVTKVLNADPIRPLVGRKWALKRLKISEQEAEDDGGDLDVLPQ